MKSIRWIITLMFMVGYCVAFGQGTPKASIMEDAFGAIRAEMVRDACDILEYNDQPLLGKITNKSIIAFDKELETRLKANPDDISARYLQLIVRDASNAAGGGLGGDDLSIYQTRINKFRTGLKTAFETGDRLKNLFGEDPEKLEAKRNAITANDSKYLGKIDILFKECQTYNKLEADGKLDDYKGQVFKPLSEKKEETTTLSTPITIKPKNDTQPKTDEKKQKLETEENNIEIEQNSALNACINWADYEAALKRWPKDKDFIKKVDDACWKMCKDIDEKEDYEQYLNTLKEYGKGEHYKEAKQRIDELTITDEEGADVGTGFDNGNENSGNENNSKENADSSSNTLWYLLAAIAVVALLLAILLRNRKKTQSQQNHPNTIEKKEETVGKENTGKKENTFKESQKDMPIPTQTPTQTPTATSTPETTPKSDTEPKSTPTHVVTQPLTSKQGEWVVVGASVKGNGHIQSGMPCQDNNKFELLGKGWGVAVVSDGAGSAAHSELGSKVVVERGVLHFKNLVEKEGWMEKNTLPSDAEWLQKSYFVLKAIRNEVEMVAKKNNVDLKSLSATCLAVVFSPLGLLAVHVGDGRMGCKTASGGWKAIMTPHKGDEANQTLFLVSEFWDIPNYVQSGVLVPESLVIREPVDAFAVMSDGCESTAWLCTAQNAETGKYYDQNKPFEGFFNPLEETLASFHKDNVPEEERKEKWYKFIESGAKGFVKEQDDKTMILGVFL